MKDRIILSENASVQLEIVKRRLQLSGQDDYIPLRIALGRSLQSKAEAEVLSTSEQPKSTKRKTLLLTTFEQKEGLLFRALISQHYKKKVEADDYVDLLTRHIEHGLWLIVTETEKISGYDYVVMISNATNISNSTKNEPNNVREEDNSSIDVIKVRIGVEKQTQKPIEYAINTANNPHFAIIGGSGSGKTYFLRNLLTEIRKASDYHTHFVIFDYKDGDIAKNKAFVEQTSATVLDLTQTPLPLNIFAGAKSESEQKRRAERIVEIVKNVEANIGKVQEDNLYNAIMTAYQNQSPYPDFSSIREVLKNISPKADSLTSVLRPLVEQGYFASKEQQIYGSWLTRTLIIDIHEIERKELVCFFVLNQIYQELKKMGEAPLNAATNARKLRIVVVMDEAHYFLQNSKRAKILEKMIREIRSSGGAVILASQSPDDYDQSEFNFLELMQFPIVLNSTPNSHKFLEQKFGLNGQQAKLMLQDIAKLNQGEAYVLVGNKPVLSQLCK